MAGPGARGGARRARRGRRRSLARRRSGGKAGHPRAAPLVVGRAGRRAADGGARARAHARDARRRSLTPPGARATISWIQEVGMSMYAVVEAGGKQHRVTPGQVIEVD
ncbi:MAG: hypothetical protein E6H02_08075, partial [Bacillati bacterium ANGP1]